MATRTCTVTLGETSYIVPALDMDQLERVTDLYAQMDGDDKSPAGKIATQRSVSRLPFAIMRIALERAEPKANGAVSPNSLDELRMAMESVLEMSGLAKPGASPQAPAAVAAPAGN